MSKTHDVFGIGNALVDTVALVGDDFLTENEVKKGTMSLVDQATQKKLLNALKDYKLKMQSGGSAANTMHGIALAGGTGFYAGKVSDDDMGNFYKVDLEQAGIKFEVPPSKQTDSITGACLVLTTPDAERSMLTHLGISSFLNQADINYDDIKHCKILYVEGYMWDGEEQKEACLEAMKIARKNDVLVTLTFSDPFCVERALDDFHKLASENLDFVFCNADEAAHFSKNDDFKQSLDYMVKHCKNAFVTNSENGAFVINEGKTEHVEGFPVTPVDTTGAGDAFAAGCLYGMSQGYSLAKSARLGNFMGSQVVQKTGARLDKQELTDFKKLEATP